MTYDLVETEDGEDVIVNNVKVGTLEWDIDPYNGNLRYYACSIYDDPGILYPEDSFACDTDAINYILDRYLSSLA